MSPLRFIKLLILLLSFGCGFQNVKNMNLDTFRSKLKNKFEGTNLIISFTEKNSSDINAEFLDFYVRDTRRNSYLFLKNNTKYSAFEIKSIDIFCGNCKKVLSDNSSFRCSQCKTVYYCGRNCQALHWKNEHKKYCKKILQKRIKKGNEDYKKAMSFIQKKLDLDKKIDPERFKSLVKKFNENVAWIDDDNKYSFSE